MSQNDENFKDKEDNLADIGFLVQDVSSDSTPSQSSQPSSVSSSDEAKTNNRDNSKKVIGVNNKDGFSWDANLSGSPRSSRPRGRSFGKYGGRRNSDKPDHNRESRDKDDSDFDQNEDFSDKEVVQLEDIRKQSWGELVETAAKHEIDVNRMLKQDVICEILKAVTVKGMVVYGEGVLDISSDGFGFLRFSDDNYNSSVDNIYVSQKPISKLGLKPGDTVRGYLREPRRSERYFSMAKITHVNGDDIKEVKNKINFDNLVPLYPQEKLNLDVNLGKNGKDFSTRIIDMMSPIGKGQRALIVAPPRTGKTILLQNIARSINQNNPEVKLIVLLIDERPEEVTDMTRSVKGEVVSSTFDEPATRHVALAEIVISKAKRYVEKCKDVVILLDSITRLARAYNTVTPSSGRVLTGGVDANALQNPKRFFGAARNTENGGSLTIIATALIDTGSKMDEVIFEEFKGTGNCEVVLDRRMAERRIFPALDLSKSGTRREEEMVDENKLSKTFTLRRFVLQVGNQVSGSSEAMEFLIGKMRETQNNEELFANMQGGKK